LSQQSQAQAQQRVQVPQERGQREVQEPQQQVPEQEE
jgi:hypothetical protein